MDKKMIVLDKEKCSGCNACVVACIDEFYDFKEEATPRRETKIYQDIENNRIYYYSLSCFHCPDPACIEKCPTGALKRDEETNMVIVDDELCIGCEICLKACSYKIPKFRNKKMVKCNGCIERLKKDLQSLCVQTCPMKALEILDYDREKLEIKIKEYEELENNIK